MDPAPATARRITNRCLVVLFVAVLWLPLTGRLLGLELLPAMSENRPLTPLPELGLNPAQLAGFHDRLELLAISL